LNTALVPIGLHWLHGTIATSMQGAILRSAGLPRKEECKKKAIANAVDYNATRTAA